MRRPSVTRVASRSTSGSESFRGGDFLVRKRGDGLSITGFSVTGDRSNLQEALLCLLDLLSRHTHIRVPDHRTELRRDDLAVRVPHTMD